MAGMVMDSTARPTSNPRSESFGYVCHRCLKCCHHKGIGLNPYEIARLARNRDLTTGEFRASWTCTLDSGALVLAQTESGACVFLGSEGCTVHPDRPLVCRLYPLARHTRSDSAEWFSHVEPHPETGGNYTGSGTIANFLATQDADPFIQAEDEYFFWLCAARETLDQVSEDEAANISAKDEELARGLLDMDVAIAHYCVAAEVAEPTDIEARKDLHLTILYQELEPATGGRHERK
jgi:uncharacterized protein